MEAWFQTLSRRLADRTLRARGPKAPRAYRCQCGRPVFFRNSECLACRTPLG